MDWMGGVHFSPCLRSVAWIGWIGWMEFCGTSQSEFGPWWPRIYGWDGLDGWSDIPPFLVDNRASLSPSLVATEPRYTPLSAEILQHHLFCNHHHHPTCPIAQYALGREPEQPWQAGRHTIHSHRLTQKSGNIIRYESIDWCEFGHHISCKERSINVA